MKIREKIKSNSKPIISFIIGGIIFGTIGAIAATITANEIQYKSNQTVEQALNELFDMADTCPEGYKCISINAKPNITEQNVSGNTYKAIVYYDPTETSTEQCTAENSVSTTETKDGCMKWYVFSETSTTYTMILDHNTTAKASSWNAAKTTLQDDIKHWTQANKNSARLINSTEVWEITKSTNGKSSWNTTSWDNFYFEGSQKSGQGTSKYAWLYDYTQFCTNFGCNVADDSNSGYWTNDSCGSYAALRVTSQSDLRCNSVTNDISGVRPVITISKS